VATTLQARSPAKTLLQFHTALIAMAMGIAIVAAWYMPRTQFEKPIPGFTGTYRCGQSTILHSMENQNVQIDQDLKMNLVGGGLQIPVGQLTKVPGNLKLATLALAPGLRRAGSEFNPDLVHEVEGHGRYIYLRGLKNGQEQYSISCTN
jgi:hypothetical protein